MKNLLLSVGLLLSILIVNTGTILGQTTIKLFTEEEPVPAAARAHVTKATGYNLNKSGLTWLLSERPASVLLQFQFENKDISLDLTESNLHSPGFFVKDAQGQPVVYDAHSIVHYKGKIKGEKHSMVAISIMKNELIAVISDSKGNINIGAINSATDTERHHVIFRESDIIASNPFNCGTDNLPPISDKTLQLGNLPFSGEAVLNTEPIDIYFEADYSCFTGSSSNITNTVNWATAMFNVSSTLYENDSVYTKMSGIKVWNSPDPYVALNTTNPVLSAFANNMSGGFPGDLAHLLSRRGLGGGIAFLNVLCSSPYYRTGVSGNLGSVTNPLPTYSWNGMVITHEVGHNIGSNHTQWCGWVGGAIDNCTTTEGGCAAGPAPTNGGTIMSYCHLKSYGINLANGFGAQPGAVVRNNVRNNTCINPKISFSTSFQTVTEENADTDNNCLDYQTVTLKLKLNYTATQPAIISLSATGIASPGLQIGPNKDVDIFPTIFTLADTTPQLIQLKVYDDAFIENKESLLLDYTIAANGTNAVKFGTYRLDILSLDHKPDSAANQLVYYEPFDAITAGLGNWTQTILHGHNSPNRWIIGNNADSSFTSNAAFVSFNGNTAGYAGSSITDSAIIRLESPPINATGFQNMRLTYQYKCAGEIGTGQGSLGGNPLDFGSVYYSTNNGVSWLLLKENIAGRSNKMLDEAILPAAANNAASLKLAFVWQNNSSIVKNPPFIIDSIVIMGTGACAIQREASAGNSSEAYLGPLQTVHFYNPVTQNIMASITNRSNVDLGCTRVEIVRTGDSASFAWGDYLQQKIADKAYRIVSENAGTTATYDLSLYYTQEEVNGWVSASGNSATEMAIVKTDGDLTQVPTTTIPVFSNYNSIGNFGLQNGKVVTGRFTGFSTFGVGKPGITAICPGNNLQLAANETALNYQWQVNTGNGYTNLANNAVYSAVTTPMLTINNPVTAWYGYQYRCILTDAIGSHSSIAYTLKFSTYWIGSQNNNWGNNLNWYCSVLPDENTDVFITPDGFMPVLSNGTTIRSLTLKQNAHLTVLPAVQLQVVK